MIASIRLAVNPAERSALYAFRYRIYVEEMGRTQKYADHAARAISDPLDDAAFNLAARHNGQIVGCVRVNFARDGGLDYYRKLLQMEAIGSAWPDRVSLCTRLMIAPEWRGTTLAVRLAIACYELGLDGGIAWNFIDCNDHLVRFFQRMGYELTHQPTHEEYGKVNAMRFDMYAMDRISAIGSPFRRSLAKHLNKGPGSQAAVVRLGQRAKGESRIPDQTTSWASGLEKL